MPLAGLAGVGSAVDVVLVCSGGLATGGGDVGVGAALALRQ